MAPRKKLTPVEEAQKNLEDVRGSLNLAKREYQTARTSLELGLATVTPEQLRALAEQIDYFELRMVGAERNLAEAKRTELAGEREALAAQIDAYAADSDSPLAQARQALEDAQEALQRFTDAVTEHNARYQEFHKAAQDIGAAYESGPAKALTPVALKGSQHWGAKGVLTDRNGLHSIDAKRILDSLFKGKLANNPIADPERPEPDKSHVFFRTAEGHSVSYAPEYAPDPIYQKTKGLTPLKGSDIWEGWEAE